MIIDMHVHSTYSDGEFSPSKIMKICNNNNIKIISITDHNNLKGSKEAMQNTDYPDVTVIPGVEMTAKCTTGGQKHILGYGIDLDNKPLNDILQAVRIANINEMKLIVDKLYEKFKFTFTDDELADLYNINRNVGRPHIAMLCLKHQYVQSIPEAFGTVLKDIKTGIKNEIELSDQECIKYILDAGGIVSLAHPFTLKLSIEETKQYIKQLMDYGVTCIEAFHSQQPKDFSIELQKIAKDFGLYMSVGSDFHGPKVKPNIYIGTGIFKNLCIENISVLTALRG